MADATPSNRDHEIVVTRQDGRFRARISELGLSAISETAADAIAEVTALQNDYMAAATRAGVADDVPHRETVDHLHSPGSAAQTAVPSGTSIARSAMVAVSDSYTRFFMKSLIAAGVFIASFGVASAIAVYFFGNLLVNVAANAVESRLTRFVNLDVNSTGFVDTTTRVATYIQGVTPERQLQLRKNLHFIATEMAPYLREVVVPLSTAFADNASAVPESSKPTNASPARP